MPSAYVTYEVPFSSSSPGSLTDSTSTDITDDSKPPPAKNSKPPAAAAPRQSRVDSWLTSTAKRPENRERASSSSAVVPKAIRGRVVSELVDTFSHSGPDRRSLTREDGLRGRREEVSMLMDPPRTLFRPAPRNAGRLRSVGSANQITNNHGRGPRSASVCLVGAATAEMFHSANGASTSNGNAGNQPSTSSGHTHQAIVHSHSQSSSSGAGSSSTSASPLASSGAPVINQQSAGISRKKIISKSQEAGLNDEELMNEDEDDVWYDKEALFRHHLREVLEKWSSIDDEIWGKIICMERNRRVAKAYARVPVLTINGGEDGFDGYRIGLAGFENPKRHSDTAQAKKLVGQGIKLKMDNDGNILVRRASASPVYVRSTTGNFQEDNCFSSEVVKLQGQLDSDKPFKVFDMKRFTMNITKEMKGPFPDRRKLELQCFTNISFVQQELDPLETPCWIMVINIVALDMLKSKLPSPALPNGSHGRGTHMRQPAMMENVSTKRFLSTPRDDHYPRLLHQQMHSMNDVTLAESNEYGDDFDDRASVSTYNFIPGYRPSSSLLPGDYEMIHPGTMAGGATTRSFRAPLHPHAQENMYRALEQQNYQDAYYAELAASQMGGYGLGANGAIAAAGYRTPLGMGQHAATEPQFKIPASANGMATGRNFTTTPSLQRFAPQHRHSRSFDSGLESDLTSVSDETDYSRWTCYSRGMHMLPHARAVNAHGQPALSRHTEWE